MLNKRIMLLVALISVIATMLVYTGAAWAEPKSCTANMNANPSGGGNALPGQTGDRARSAAEANHEDFGQQTAALTQFDEECEPIGASGPPEAYDPNHT